MCLVILGKFVVIIEEFDEIFCIGKVLFDGIMKKVNLMMVLEVKVGDYVFVYVGVVIQVVDEVEVWEIFDLFKKMGEFDELMFGLVEQGLF